MRDFKTNDIVILNKDASFGDMIKDNWNGCQTDTLDFLRYKVPYKEYFKVVEFDQVWVTLENVKRDNGTDDFLLVNKNILKLAPYKLKTMEELQKELGYNIKIVK